MKTIQNEYFNRFCDVIKRSLTDVSKFNVCLSDMVSDSEDEINHINVYDFPAYNMEVIKLDEYTKDFKIKRQSEMPDVKNHQPRAVDAICINKSNEWYLIEFKNEKLKAAKKDAQGKMLDSLWLIAFLYSKLSEKFADETDFLKFARENITFITVVNSNKNLRMVPAIGVTWAENGPHYRPESYYDFKGYCFKDAYVLTESGLRSFVAHFD